MRSFLLATASSLALLGASRSWAQQVLVVASNPGPGVFSTQVQPAVAAAADGDLILVRLGTYDGFTVDGKALTIVAESPGDAKFKSSIVVKNLSIAQGVLLEGLIGATTQAGIGLELSNDAGPVWVERCDFKGVASLAFPFVAAHGVSADHCASVTIQNAFATGGSTYPIEQMGIRSVSSNVSVTSTVVTGGPGGNFNIFTESDGGAAVGLSGGGTFFASGSTLQGGKGSNGITIGETGQDGGDGLDVGAGCDAATLACTILPGGGGIGGPGGAGGHPGVAVRVSPGGAYSALPGMPRQFTVFSPVREQQVATLEFGGMPGEIAGVLVSTSQDLGLFLLPFGGVIQVSLASSQALALGTIAIDGTLSIPVGIPDLPPSLLGSALYIQSIFFDPPLSYVAIGPATALVVLDSSL